MASLAVDALRCWSDEADAEDSSQHGDSIYKYIYNIYIYSIYIYICICIVIIPSIY